jgi:hypothetical protein
MRPNFKPLGRKGDLVVQEISDETLIYDMNTDRALCLNSTAGKVWAACNGLNSVSEIAQILSNKVAAPVNDDLIWLAINQLDRNNLLEKRKPEDVNPLGRREVIKKIGLSAAISLPVIFSVVAPRAVDAQSCLPIGTACSMSAQCCSSCCKSVGGGIFECKPGGGACLP